jgi:ubiquinone/menaquinone biosynthesis C-methylase UbiE
VAEDEFTVHDADSYDQIEEQFQDALDESLDPVGREMLFDLVAEMGLSPDATVLDVGSGSGRRSIELARHLGVMVCGIEPSSHNLNTARHKLKEAGKAHAHLDQRVSFMSGTARNLPIADQSADLVWCRDVLCLVDPIAEAYAEFRRVLRPGGRVLVYQMFATNRLEPAEADWLLPVLGCSAASMRPEVTETAIGRAGLRLDQRIIVSSQWHEYTQERSGAAGRDLIHAARLLRDPDRYLSRFGKSNYDIALADCFWHIYQMIGKLSGRIYVLTAGPAD